jgi:hypothetical protein
MKTTTYGPWTFNRKNLTLTHENGYEIDVETWTTSAQVLDWIFQIHAKGWEDAAPALLDAMEDIIDPQANLCSFGQEKGPIDVTKNVSD